MSPTEPALGPAVVRRAAARYLATFATRDVRAIAELHAPDGEFRLRLGRHPVRGREAIAVEFQQVFDQWPELDAVVHRLIVGDDHWVLDWALTARRPGGSPEDPRVSIDCLDVVHLDASGRIVRKDTFVDGAELAAASAPAPPAGTR